VVIAKDEVSRVAERQSIVPFTSVMENLNAASYPTMELAVVRWVESVADVVLEDR